MAEIEFSVLARQCLDCRIPDKKTLIDEVAAFQQRRNQDSGPAALTLKSGATHTKPAGAG